MDSAVISSFSAHPREEMHPSKGGEEEEESEDEKLQFLVDFSVKYLFHSRIT